MRKEILVLSSKVGRRKENPKELLEIGVEGGNDLGEWRLDLDELTHNN